MPSPGPSSCASEHFSPGSFLQVSATCALGVFAVATAVAGYFLAPMGTLSRVVMTVAGVMLVAPGWQSDVTALILAAFVVAAQFFVSSRRRRSP